MQFDYFLVARGDFKCTWPNIGSTQLVLTWVHLNRLDVSSTRLDLKCIRLDLSWSVPNSTQPNLGPTWLNMPWTWSSLTWLGPNLTRPTWLGLYPTSSFWLNILRLKFDVTCVKLPNLNLIWSNLSQYVLNLTWHNLG